MHSLRKCAFKARNQSVAIALLRPSDGGNISPDHVYEAVCVGWSFKVGVFEVHSHYIMAIARGGERPEVKA